MLQTTENAPRSCCGAVGVGWGSGSEREHLLDGLASDAEFATDVGL